MNGCTLLFYYEKYYEEVCKGVPQGRSSGTVDLWLNKNSGDNWNSFYRWVRQVGIGKVNIIEPVLRYLLYWLRMSSTGARIFIKMYVRSHIFRSMVCGSSYPMGTEKAVIGTLDSRGGDLTAV